MAIDPFIIPAVSTVSFRSEIIVSRQNYRTLHSQGLNMFQTRLIQAGFLEKVSAASSTTVEAALYAAKKDRAYGLRNGSWLDSRMALAKYGR